MPISLLIFLKVFTIEKLTDVPYCLLLCLPNQIVHYVTPNTGLQGFVVEKLWVVSGVIFDVQSESGIRISLSGQDFEIFEVMCSKNGIFRYFRGYVQGARIFFGCFLKCHHLALLFPFKMSYYTVTSDFFSQRYGHIKF